MIYDRSKVIQHYRRECLDEVYQGIDHLAVFLVLLIIGLVAGVSLECVRWELALQGLIVLIGTMILIWVGVWILDQHTEEKVEKILRNMETTNRAITDVQKRLQQLTKLYEL